MSQRDAGRKQARAAPRGREASQGAAGGAGAPGGSGSWLMSGAGAASAALQPQESRVFSYGSNLSTASSLLSPNDPGLTSPVSPRSAVGGYGNVRQYGDVEYGEEAGEGGEGLGLYGRQGAAGEGLEGSGRGRGLAQPLLAGGDGEAGAGQGRRQGGSMVGSGIAAVSAVGGWVGSAAYAGLSAAWGAVDRWRGGGGGGAGAEGQGQGGQGQGQQGYQQVR